MVTILVAGLVVAVLVLVAVMITDDDDETAAPLEDVSSDTDDSPADPEVQPEDEPEPEPDEPGPPPTEEELNAIVEDLKTFVEEERGLEFIEPVDVELADDDEFVDRLLDGIEEETDYFAQVEVLYKALELVDADSDFAEEFEGMLGAGVVGFYDPETKELVVRATELTPFTRTVIVHELTHALDDQHFNLNRPEYDDAPDEISFGFSAIVEGNAMYIEEQYFAEELTDDEQDDALREEMIAGTEGGIPDVSFALLELMGAPYIHGPELVSDLLDAGGQERLDAAFAEPPRTSEQVLSPDRYIAGEGAVEVTHPVADGEFVMEAVLGQLFVQVTLDESVDNDLATEASEGWGGDWAVAWRDGERSCMRLTIVGDTPSDSDELQEAWSEWADEHTGTATAEQPAPGGPVTVTACSA